MTPCHKPPFVIHWLNYVGQMSPSRSPGQNFFAWLERPHKEMYTWNMKARPLMIQKLWQRLKFLECRSKVTVKSQGHQSWFCFERTLLAEFTYQIWSLYLLRFKSYGQGKGFKICTGRSNVIVKATRSKLLAWPERPGHKECTCEIWKLYL